MALHIYGKKNFCHIGVVIMEKKIAEKLNLSAAREQVFGGFSEKRAIYLGKCRREGKSRVLHNLREKAGALHGWLHKLIL